MNHLICLSAEPWQTDPNRTQQLMTRLKDTKILFFEPAASERDKRYKDPGRKVRPGLTVYTLPPIMAVEERYHYFFDRGQRKLARYIEERAERARMRDPVLWCASPAYVHLIDYLSHKGLVYDCHQEWDRLPLPWESEMAATADVIFAASPTLVDRLSPCNDNIAMIPQGSNYTLFSRTELPRPRELGRPGRPIFGFLGDLRRDLDVEPLLHAADLLPQADFVLLGRVEDHPLLPALEARPNLLFPGPRLLPEQPEYVTHFDVCLNFLRWRDRPGDLIPARIFDYFCTGTPVVSMLFPGQVEHFPDVIYSARSPAEFSQLCKNALLEAGDWARNRRREYGAAASWSQRAGEVIHILETIGLF